MAAARSKTYRYRTTFDAPLPFVFRWCTDFDPDDARLEHEEYERKILERSGRKVVYEDLEATPKGWIWKRQIVRLRPPDRWSCTSIGNTRISELEYRLRERADGGTDLEIVSHRTPGALGGPAPTAAAYQKMMDGGWRNFRRALERDYRAERGAPPRRRR